jgi:hypothetical protein
VTGPNLSAWAINHPALIRYLMGLLLLSGAYAYFTLGQMDDPEFTLGGMTLTVYVPVNFPVMKTGSSARALIPIQPIDPGK